MHKARFTEYGTDSILVGVGPMTMYYHVPGLSAFTETHGTEVRNAFLKVATFQGARNKKLPFEV